jgi:hypothetical protein
MANKKKPRQPVWQLCVPCRLVCVRVLEGEGTSVVWPRENSKMRRHSLSPLTAGSLPSECCVSVDWLTLTLQVHVFNLIRGPLPFSHHLDVADPGGLPKSVLSQWSTLEPFMPDPGLFESRAVVLDVTLGLCMISAESAGSRALPHL